MLRQLYSLEEDSLFNMQCYSIGSSLKLVSVEDVSSAPLRSAPGQDKHPYMLMVSGLIENRFDGT